MFKEKIKKTKHSYQTKLSVVRLYKKGYGSSTISSRLGVARCVVGRWLYTYRRLGLSGLKSSKNIMLSSEQKRFIVKQFLYHCVSIQELSVVHRISTVSIYRWVWAVQEYGFGVFTETEKQLFMGRPKNKKPESELEILREENLRLKASNALLKKVIALVEKRESQQQKIG